MADYNMYPPRKFTSATSANASPPAVSFPPLPPTDVQPISEHEFLHGTPHPAVVAHMQHAIDRVTPPSLVRMDRAEAALAAVVARRKLEQHGQILTDEWWDLKRYEDGIVDRYIEATS